MRHEKFSFHRNLNVTLSLSKGDLRSLAWITLRQAQGDLGVLMKKIQKHPAISIDISQLTPSLRPFVSDYLFPKFLGVFFVT